MTNNQIGIYMNYRTQGLTQELAAAKAGCSLRSAKRIEVQKNEPISQEKPTQTKVNSKDPFSDVWENELVPLLEKNPKLQAVSLLHQLQDDSPGLFPDRLLRTLQRRVQQWKAVYGPEKEVMFLQEHPPGWQGLSDFTDCGELGVAINSQPFPHLIYHFWAAFSTWEYAFVITGGESYTALAEGLQGALWGLGGVPTTHRTDSLSAAYKNLSKETSEDFTKAYKELCEHYSMEPTRNNKGVKHENGSVETSHRHLKSRLAQALMIRGSKDFSSLSEYRTFVDERTSRHNQGILHLLAEERKFLKPLPKNRTRDFDVEFIRVSTSSIIAIRQVRYSVPSRLIGMQLKVHIFDDRIECFLASTHVLTMNRLRWKQGTRPRIIDYRHLIESLARKPQAFRRYIFRDDLFPTCAFKFAWELLDKELEDRTACCHYVGILKLAAEHGEDVVSGHLEKILAAGTIPKRSLLEELLPPKKPPEVIVEIDSRDPQSYDQLLSMQGKTL